MRNWIRKSPKKASKETGALRRQRETAQAFVEAQVRRLGSAPDTPADAPRRPQKARKAPARAIGHTDFREGGKETGKRAKTKQSTETALVKAIIQLLQAHGFMAFRRNTGAVTTSYTRKDGVTRDRFFRFSEPGMADIWGWQRGTGRHIEVEVKRPGLKPTSLQLQWLQMAQERGCIAFWCDSMEMAEKKLKGEL